MEAKSRKAKLILDGTIVIWHMFYVDRNGEPKALIEYKDGTMGVTNARFIHFIDIETDLSLK